jgi:hypothetical protein
MEGNVPEFGPKDVHFAAILEDNFVIELNKCFFCCFDFSVLHKCFPNLGLFEDQYFDDDSVGAENLIQIVVSYDITKLIVYAYQQNGTLRTLIFPVSHLSDIVNMAN